MAIGVGMKGVGTGPILGVFVWPALLGVLVDTRVQATQAHDSSEMHAGVRPLLPPSTSSSWSGPLCTLAPSSQGTSLVWFAVSAEKVFEDSEAPKESCGEALEVRPIICLHKEVSCTTSSK